MCASVGDGTLPPPIYPSRRCRARRATEGDAESSAPVTAASPVGLSRSEKRGDRGIGRVGKRDGWAPQVAAPSQLAPGWLAPSIIGDGADLLCMRKVLGPPPSCT
jgi:hypothetical protein